VSSRGLQKVRWRSLIYTDEAAWEGARRAWDDHPELIGIVPLEEVMSRSRPVGTVWAWIVGDPAQPDSLRWGNHSAIPSQPRPDAPDDDPFIADLIGSFNQAAGMLAAFASGHDARAMREAVQAFEYLSRHQLRETLAERDGWGCHICGRTITERGSYNVRNPSVGFPDIDHVIPLSRGGSHWWSNVRLAHHGCNLRKRIDDPTHDRDVALFERLAQDEKLATSRTSD
jgi:HNH endonuclease